MRFTGTKTSLKQNAIQIIKTRLDTFIIDYFLLSTSYGLSVKFKLNDLLLMYSWFLRSRKFFLAN